MLPLRRLAAQPPAGVSASQYFLTPAEEFRRRYRGLLREAGYLPDSEARDYFRSYIASRFRRLRLWPLERARGRPESDEQLEALRLRARAMRALLVRANLGEITAIGEVLGRAYGRIGPRRQQMLARCIAADEPANDAALGAAVAQANAEHSAREDGASEVDRKLAEELSRAASTSATAPLPLPPALRALLERQVQLRARLTKPYQLRRVDPEPPGLNTWGRPMPIRRVRNQRHEALLHLLQRALPPLPAPLWHRVRTLAAGETPWTEEVLRRGEPAYGRRLRWAKYDQLFIRVHTITPRFMQRRYAELFPLCPLLERADPNAATSSTGPWTVLFGELQPTPIPEINPEQLARYGITSADVDDDAMAEQV